MLLIIPKETKGRRCYKKAVECSTGWGVYEWMNGWMRLSSIRLGKLAIRITLTHFSNYFESFCFSKDATFPIYGVGLRLQELFKQLGWAMPRVLSKLQTCQQFLNIFKMPNEGSEGSFHRFPNIFACDLESHLPASRFHKAPSTTSLVGQSKETKFAGAKKRT